MNIINKHFGAQAHADMNLKRGEWKSMWFEIPGDCHLKCGYCFAKPNYLKEKNKFSKDKLSEDEYISILEHFKASGGKFIGIPGKGEPFHPRNRELVKKIIAKCKELELHLTIFTTIDQLYKNVDEYYSRVESEIKHKFPKIGQDSDEYYSASISQEVPEYDEELISFIYDHDNVILLVKYNHNNSCIQDKIVAQKGYAFLRNKMLDYLISKGLNKTKRLGIVTSIMNENKNEILSIYKYSKVNDLIFDCDTILPKGKGIKFDDENHIPVSELHQIFSALKEEGAITHNPAGTYVGAACDRVKHHLYIDLYGDIYPCIGCSDTLKKDLYLGNIRDLKINSIDQTLFKSKHKRSLLANHYDQVFMGVCSKCLNFKDELCYSCFGRAVSEFSTDSNNKIIAHTHGCINHKPDLNSWLVATDEYVRTIMGEKLYEESFYEDWESLWLPNRNISFTLKQLVDKEERKHYLNYIIEHKDPQESEDEIAYKGIRKLKIDSFSRKKHYSFSDLNFPLNKIWDFIIDPKIIFDDYLKSIVESEKEKTKETLYHIFKKSTLSNVFLPSMKLLLDENDKNENIQLCVLNFYDNLKRKYFYRTFAKNNLDLNTFDQQQNILPFVALSLYRLPEAFKSDSTFFENIFNLSDLFRKDVFSDYELVLSNDDDYVFNLEPETIERENYVLQMYELLEIQCVKDRAQRVFDFIAKQETSQIENLKIHLNSRLFSQIDHNSPKNIDEESIVCFLSEIEKILDEEYNNISIDDKLENFYYLNISKSGNQLNFSDATSCESIQNDINEPLIKLIQLFKEEKTLAPILNYLVFLSLNKMMGINYYFIYHSTNFAQKRDDKRRGRDAMPSGTVICSKKRLSSIQKNNFKLTISNLLSPFDEKYNVKSLEDARKASEDARKASEESELQSLISRTIARNSAHHIESHMSHRATIDKILQRIGITASEILDRSKNLFEADFDSLIEMENRFTSYKSERNDFIAGIDTNTHPVTMRFYQDIILPFAENSLIMDNIAKSEGVCFGKIEDDKIQQEASSKLRIRVFYHKDIVDKANGVKCPQKQINQIDCINGNCQTITEDCGLSHRDLKLWESGNEYYEMVAHFKGVNEEVGKNCCIHELPYFRKFKDGKFYHDSPICTLNDIEISVPGTLGAHCIYSVLENHIRNTVKHAKSEIIKKVNHVDIIIKIKKKNDDFFEINLTTNIPTFTEVLTVNCDFKNLEENTRSKVDGNTKALGMADIRINASLLKFDEINQDNLGTALKLIPIEKIEDSKNIISEFKFATNYNFVLTRPRKIAFIGNIGYEIKDKGISKYADWNEYINSTDKKHFEFAIIDSDVFNVTELKNKDNIDEFLTKLPWRIMIARSDNQTDTAHNELTQLFIHRKALSISIKEYAELRLYDEIIEKTWKLWLKRWGLDSEDTALHIYFEQPKDDTPTNSMTELSLNNNDSLFVWEGLNKLSTKDESYKNKKNHIFFDRHGSKALNNAIDIKYKFFKNELNSWVYIDKSNRDFDYLFDLHKRWNNKETPYKLIEAGLLRVLVIDERAAELSNKKIALNNFNQEIITDTEVDLLFYHLAKSQKVVFADGIRINNEQVYSYTDKCNCNVEFEEDTIRISYPASNNDRYEYLKYNSCDFDIVIIHRTLFNKIIEKKKHELFLNSFPFVYIDTGGGVLSYDKKILSMIRKKLSFFDITNIFLHKGMAKNRFTTIL